MAASVPDLATEADLWQPCGRGTHMVLLVYGYTLLSELTRSRDCENQLVAITKTILIR